MKSYDLEQAYTQARQAYIQAFTTRDTLLDLLDTLPLTGSIESAYREDIQPIIEQANQATSAAFDVQYDLESLIEDLLAQEKNETHE